MENLNNNIDINDEENKNTKTEQQKTYTQDELLVLVQSETDKRVQQALSTQQRKHEKELQKQKSLSGLDAEQRAKAESEQRIADLEEQLQQYRLSNTKAEIAKVLSSRGLSAELVEYVVTTDDIEECQAKIEKLDKLFKQMVKNEVDKRLNSTTPKTSTVGLDGQITKEQFNKMTLAQQSELYANNKELYLQLTK